MATTHTPPFGDAIQVGDNIVVDGLAVYARRNFRAGPNSHLQAYIMGVRAERARVEAGR